MQEENLAFLGYYTTEHNGCTFAYVCGREYWKEILGSYVPEEMIDETLELDGCQWILLQGPFGSGKNMLLSGQAGELLAKGYQYLEVDLAKVPEEKQRALFDYLTTEYLVHTACYLFLEHLEKLADTAILLDLFEKSIMEDYQLIVGSCMEDLSVLDPEVRKIWTIYPVGLPGREDRKAYLEEMLTHIFESSGIGMKLLLDQTENYNYIQLRALVSQVKFKIKHRLLTHQMTVSKATHNLDGDLVEQVMKMQQKAGKKQEKESVELSAEALQSVMNSVNTMQQTVGMGGSRPLGTQRAGMPAGINRGNNQSLLEQLKPDKVFNKETITIKNP